MLHYKMISLDQVQWCVSSCLLSRQPIREGSVELWHLRLPHGESESLKWRHIMTMELEQDLKGFVNGGKPHVPPLEFVSGSRLLLHASATETFDTAPLALI